MDIKWKNNRKTRIIITVLALVLISAGTVLAFPGISSRADRQLAGWREELETEQINSDTLEKLFSGSYVLFYELSQREGTISAADLYFAAQYENTLAMDTVGLINDLKAEMNSRMGTAASEFDQYRMDIDYCIVLGDGKYEKNTGQPLEAVYQASLDQSVIRSLQEYYNNYFVMRYDENGILTVEKVYSQNVDPGMIIKILGLNDRTDMFWEGLPESYVSLFGREDGLVCEWKKPSDFTVIYGIPKNAENQLIWQYGDYEYGSDYLMMVSAYSQAGGMLLFAGGLLLTTALMFAMTSRRVWRCEIPMNRPGNRYVMEVALLGVLIVLNQGNYFLQVIWSHKSFESYQKLFEQLFYNDSWTTLWQMISAGAQTGILYVLWYVSIRALRPAVTLGIREYVRQYSLIYQIFPWIKARWEDFVYETRHIDFSEKSTKMILKIVVINYVVLAVVSMFWFFGIGVLLVYSVVVFYLIKKYYDRAGRDYQTLLSGVGQIARGNLDAEIDRDIGMFEPFKEQLAMIRFGFKKAVDEEVKSQRMKTELITNVSHDLKTPLTAITTYIELLKKEDITEEERRSYIETLERKSLRLKVLIEDLFEVSKATSNSMTLDLMKVDVVKLMKQVSVEHTDKFTASSLDLRWNVPEDQVILMLDNQKTYRIFENLFVNIQKYAMPGSRVYVEVKRIPGTPAGGAAAQNDSGFAAAMGGMPGGMKGAPDAAGFSGGMPGAVPGRMDAAGFSGGMPGAVPGRMDAAGMTGAGISGIAADFVEITLKNMSAAELSFRPDEITERFVRGDASRNTEGSGLGLAIAKSFTEAQGGTLHIEVDGDLFKVVIRWKCVL